MPRQHRDRLIRDALFCQPWAITPEKAAEIMAFYAGRETGDALTPETLAAMFGEETPPESAAYEVCAGGVALLRLYGTIVPRANLLSAYSGGTDARAFAAAIDQAADDRKIAAIVVDADSPGGYIGQVPEAAAAMRRAAKRKTTIVVGTNQLASGGYWIAAGAGQIVASPSNVTGSVGVLGIFLDESKANEKRGRNYQVITAGKNKAIGHPFTPLTETERAVLQERIDAAYAIFVGDLARYRDTTAAKIEANYGQGKIFYPPDALAAGLIDRIATLDEILAELAAPRRSARPPAPHFPQRKGV